MLWRHCARLSTAISSPLIFAYIFLGLRTSAYRTYWFVVLLDVQHTSVVADGVLIEI